MQQKQVFYGQRVFFFKRKYAKHYLQYDKQSYCIIKLYNTDHMDILKCIA